MPALKPAGEVLPSWPLSSFSDGRQSRAFLGLLLCPSNRSLAIT